MQPNKLANLDMLRGVAVLLVMGRHFTELPAHWPDNWLVTAWIRGGWVGVDLFFVLSGFLVSGLLFREFLKHERIAILRFVIRRGFKIYPAFYVLLAATFVAALARPKPVFWKGFLGEFCFVQNYVAQIWAHTWSLAIEEHFYLLLCLGLALLARCGPRGGNPFRYLPLITLTTAAGILALRIGYGLSLPFGFETHTFPTHLRMDSLLFGVFLSYLYHFERPAWDRWVVPSRRALACAGALLFLPAFLFYIENTVFLYTVGFTVLYLGGGGLVSAAVASPQAHRPLSRALAYLGGYSYSVYLWHLPVCKGLMPLVARLTHHALNWWAYAGLYLVAACLVGIFMGRLIETPFLRLRDRLFPSRSAPLGPASA